MNKLVNSLFLSGCLGLFYFAEKLDETRRKSCTGDKESIVDLDKREFSRLSYLNSRDLLNILKAEKYILSDQIKSRINISTPFNRKIKYIYNLPFYYVEYENYNFNKLSDLFLNIHIFIN